MIRKPYIFTCALHTNEILNFVWNCLENTVLLFGVVWHLGPLKKKNSHFTRLCLKLYSFPHCSRPKSRTHNANKPISDFLFHLYSITIQYNYYLFTRLNLDDVIRSVKLTTFLKYWYQINWLVFCIS